MNTNKIMRVLNAVYNYMTEKNGVEPFPTNVFLERKEIIKEMSRRQDGRLFCNDKEWSSVGGFL